MEYNPYMEKVFNFTRFFIGAAWEIPHIFYLESILSIEK
jgi:hypothetical protein